MRRADNRRRGLTRAARLTPERRREIAAQGSVGRRVKAAGGLPRREVVAQVVERLGEIDIGLACYVRGALGVSDWELTANLLDLGLTDEQWELLDLVLYRLQDEVRAERAKREAARAAEYVTA